MKLHEYQAKELFRRYSVPVPEGITASNPGEALDAARRLSAYPVVVKAQIHAGGRGKGGGVRVARNDQEVTEAATVILGSRLVTAQTGPQGRQVHRLLVEQVLDLARELYLSIIPDRSSAALLVMASQDGGMDIETVAANTPERIIRVKVDPLLSIQPFHCRRVAFGLGLPPILHRHFTNLLTNLFRLFVENDCGLVEVNPLVVTGDEQLIALDAKIDLDDNGLPRHPELASWRDEAEEDPLELAAARAGLNYINLDGNIGNMVNGAGLAMATMDLIKQAGGEPANFLDVGGGANAAMIEEGFRIILSDPKVRGILINIFGGILRCDVLAEGIIQAARSSRINVPVVIRMEGTNVDKGRRLLADSGLELTTAVDLADAAGKIAAIINSGSRA